MLDASSSCSVDDNDQQQLINDEHDGVLVPPKTHPLEEETQTLKGGDSTPSTILTNPDESFSNYSITNSRRTSTTDKLISAQYDKRASISLFNILNALTKLQHEHSDMKEQFVEQFSTASESEGMEYNTLDEADVHHDVNSQSHASLPILTTVPLMIDQNNLLNETTSLDDPTTNCIDSSSTSNTTTTARRGSDETFTDAKLTTSIPRKIEVVKETNSFTEGASSQWIIVRLLISMWSTFIWLYKCFIGLIRASHHMSVLDEICSSYDSSSPTSMHDHQLSRDCAEVDHHNHDDDSDFILWRRVHLHDSPSKAIVVDHARMQQKKPTLTLSVPYLRNFAHLLKSFSFSNIVNDRTASELKETTLERRRSKSDPNKHNSIDPSTTSTAPKMTQSKSFSNIEETKELKRRLELYSFP